MANRNPAHTVQTGFLPRIAPVRLSGTPRAKPRRARARQRTPARVRGPDGRLPGRHGVHRLHRPARPLAGL